MKLKKSSLPYALKRKVLFNRWHSKAQSIGRRAKKEGKPLSYYSDKSEWPVIVCKKINFLPYKMRIVFQTDPEMNNLKLIFTVSLQFLILKNIRDRVWVSRHFQLSGESLSQANQLYLSRFEVSRWPIQFPHMLCNSVNSPSSCNIAFFFLHPPLFPSISLHVPSSTFIYLH